MGVSKAAVREPTIKWQANLRAATDRRAHTVVLVSASVVASWTHSCILKGHSVRTLLVIIIPKGNCANVCLKYCQALLVYMLGILPQRGVKFFFFTNFRHTVFHFELPLDVLPSLTSIFSKISKSQIQANPALKCPGPFMQELPRWNYCYPYKACKMWTGIHWQRLASKSSLSLHILKSYLNVT